MACPRQVFWIVVAACDGGPLGVLLRLPGKKDVTSVVKSLFVVDPFLFQLLVLWVEISEY